MAAPLVRDPVAEGQQYRAVRLFLEYIVFRVILSAWDERK